MLRIKSPQDLGAGVILLGVGIGGLIFGRELTFGTAGRMGPGFFPTILSWLILGFGGLIAARAFAIDGEKIDRMQLRPLALVLISILAFALLIERVGLALAVAAVVLLAGLARSNLRPLELAMLALGLAVSSVVVFVYGLGQPLPAWWGR